MKAPHGSRCTLLVAIAGVLVAALLPSVAARADPVPADRAPALGQPMSTTPGQVGLAETKKKDAKKKATKKKKKKAKDARNKAGKKAAKNKKKGTGKPGSAVTPSPQVPGVGASDAPASDYSSSTPQTLRDNIVGDFRGAGYQQRMRVENDQLVVRDPAQQGGKVTSVTTDLAPAPDTVNFNVQTLAGVETYPLSTYSQWADDKTLSNKGAFEFLFNMFHINTVYLAEMDGFVYILGTQGSNGYNPDTDASAPSNQYRVRLYKIPVSRAVSGCATASCAVATFDFPTAWNLDGGIGFILPYFPRAIGPSSLAAGKVGGKGFLAVGLTDDGVYIVDADSLSVVYQFTGHYQPDMAQMVPTALAWDPAGSGLLAVGVTGRGNVGYFVSIGSNGQATSWHTWPLAPGDSLIPTPMTAAVLDQPDNAAHPKVGVFGLSDGTVAMIDPAPAWANTIAGTTGPMPGLPVAINPIPRVNPVVGGGPDFAVSFAGSGTTFGGVLRWPAGSAVVSLLPLTPSGGTSLSADDFDTWYPGLKQGRLSITNASDEEVQVSLRSSPDAGKGCWYAPAWADAASFPDSVTVAAGATSPRYVVGYQSSGSDGSCFTTDATGVKRAYLVIVPTNRPADAEIVALRIDTQPQLKLSLPGTDQAGSGSTSASLSAKLEQLAAIGSWNLTVDTSGLPTPAAAPQVSLVQLTPGASALDNPLATSPVHRLNIKALTWNVPGLNTSSNSRLQAVIPPLDVQGSNNGTNWTSIGSFLPTGVVNYDPTKGTATTSAGSFYWENTNTASYTSLRVVAGTGADAQASDPVTLPTEAITPPYAVSSMTLAAANPSTAFTPNGIDSYPLTVTVNLGDPTPPAGDPTQYVYYRKSPSAELITNLTSAGKENAFVGVQPAAGANPNTTAGRVGTTKNPSVTGTDYLTTTDTDESDIIAVIASSADKAYAPTNVLKVVPTLMTLQLGSGSATGFTVNSCAVGSTGACGVADIAPAGTGTGPYRAAIYQAGMIATQSTDAGPSLLGVLFKPLALNNKVSLPIAWTTTNTTTVATSAVVMNYSTDSVAVSNPGSFPTGANTVVVPVVSRGLLIMASVGT